MDLSLLTLRIIVVVCSAQLRAKSSCGQKRTVISNLFHLLYIKEFISNLYKPPKKNVKWYEIRKLLQKLAIICVA